MPGSSSSKPALRVGTVLSLHPQGIDRAGLKSPSSQGYAEGLRREATAAARAISAWHGSPAEQRRRREWLAIGLPHNSSHLFARLPFGDAIRLAALVGTGTMTWAEVNVALDASKLAIARHRGRQDMRDPDAWETARQAREDEIWARYHAKCDALFAEEEIDANTTHPWCREALRDRERMLERLRSERDQALANLDRGMGAPPRHAVSIARTQLTAVEGAALRKLEASGFVASADMEDAIQRLAMPLAVVAKEANEL